MANRMEKRTCGAPKLAQRCRNLAEEIRHGLLAEDIRRRQKTGRLVGVRVDDVYVGPDLISVTGDEDAARLAAELLRKGYVLNVEVHEHCSRPGVWIASGATR